MAENIIISIGHPGHVHFFKHFINIMGERGYEITIIATDKPIIKQLLNVYGFDYYLYPKHKKNMLGKAIDRPYIYYTLSKLVKKSEARLLMGVGGNDISVVGALTKKPSIVFTDTELATIANLLTFPFSTIICTPKAFKLNLGSKHIRYNGYQELAYLHPNYFKPDSHIIDHLNLTKDEYIILRFIGWGASHDVGLRGIERGKEYEIIKTLEDFGQVVISSELPLRGEFKKYELKIPPEEIHTVLYYSKLYIGEGGTMAAEAAILGTPAIHIEATKNGTPTGELSGNFVELKNRYELLYFYPNQEKGLEKALELLENKKTKKQWREKRERLLKEKIDVTKWMVEIAENFLNGELYGNINRIQK